MLTLIILILSVLLQFFSAFWALRLMKITGNRMSWILISVGLLFMAIRRLIEVYYYVVENPGLNLTRVNDWLGFIISVTITAGVIMIGKIFSLIKNVEKERMESEKKFITLFNSSSDEIYAIDFKGDFIEMNQVVCDALGYTKEELLKMNIRDIKSAKYADQTDFLIQKIIHHGIYVFESEQKTKYGQIIPVEIKSRIIDYNSEKAILSMARDVSERLQMERKILNAIIETEEKDKERFAKDLHDGLGTILSSINLYINMIKSKNTDENERQNLLDYTKGLIDEAILSTKEIANNLRPNMINSFGLSMTIKSFIKKINDTGLIKIHFNSNTEDTKLNRDLEVTLYRIIKELINNTLKHASANHITINLLVNNDNLTLVYADNGIGFNLEEVMKIKEHKGMGLSNIISRVKAIGGKFEIQSEENKGTEICIVAKI